MAHVNKGIHMSGGTINAENIAVGDNARAGAEESGEDKDRANTLNGDARTAIQAGHIDTVVFHKEED